eukprot:3979037-Pyramimonas_sp.AAC.1
MVCPSARSDPIRAGIGLAESAGKTNGPHSCSPQADKAGQGLGSRRARAKTMARTCAHYRQTKGSQTIARTSARAQQIYKKGRARRG